MQRLEKEEDGRDRVPAHFSHPWGALCDGELLAPESQSGWALDVLSKVSPQVETKIGILCG